MEALHAKRLTLLQATAASRSALRELEKLFRREGDHGGLWEVEKPLAAFLSAQYPQQRPQAVAGVGGGPPGLVGGVGGSPPGLAVPRPSGDGGGSISVVLGLLQVDVEKRWDLSAVDAALRG